MIKKDGHFFVRVIAVHKKGLITLTGPFCSETA